MTQTPDKNYRLDFSEFHPLDHWIMTVDCFRWYGGPWRHMRLWWDFQCTWGCLIGKHHYWGEPISKEKWMSGEWENDAETKWKCVNCGKEKHETGRGRDFL